MDNSTELSRILVEIPKEQHRRLKILAAARGETLRQIILKAINDLEINECLFHEHIPNEETEQALKESETCKNATSYKSFDDFCKKFGI